MKTPKKKHIEKSISNIYIERERQMYIVDVNVKDLKDIQKLKGRENANERTYHSCNLKDVEEEFNTNETNKLRYKKT